MDERRETTSRPRRTLRHRLRKWRRVRSARQALLRLGTDLRPVVDGVIARASTVGNLPVFDPGRLPWTRELEANWKRVRQEAEQVVAQQRLLPALCDLSPDHTKIASGPGRRCCILYQYG